MFSCKASQQMGAKARAQEKTGHLGLNPDSVSTISLGFIFSRDKTGSSQVPPHRNFKRIYQAQMVKNLSAMQETQAQFLGQEDSLEKRVATHSSILAWRIPWTEEPGGLHPMRSQRVRHDWATNTYTMR